MSIHYGPRSFGNTRSLNLIRRFPDAIGVYSLKAQGKSVLSEPIVKIRRSSDNSEQDFTAQEIESGDLIAWVGNNDGFVSVWYDQSGNDNHSVQTDPIKQPKLVDAGTLIVDTNGVPAMNFDRQGQELIFDFNQGVTGDMLHLTKDGIYSVGVEIPVGDYTFGRWQIWDLSDLVVLDQNVSSMDVKALLVIRNKEIPNFGTDWTSAFRDRPEIVSMPSFDFTGVTTMESAFQNSNASQWLFGELLDTAVDVTDFRDTFRFNNLTEIPENLFANNGNVTNFALAFFDNNLTEIPENLFANNPNVGPGTLGSFDGFRVTFADNSNLTTVPAGVFDNQTRCLNYEDVFTNCALTQQSVDNVLVSINVSAQANNITNGRVDITGGTNSPPGTAGNDAIAALEAKGWTINVNS